VKGAALRKLQWSIFEQPAIPVWLIFISHASAP